MQERLQKVKDTLELYKGLQEYLEGIEGFTSYKKKKLQGKPTLRQDYFWKLKKQGVIDHTCDRVYELLFEVSKPVDAGVRICTYLYTFLTEFESHIGKPIRWAYKEEDTMLLYLGNHTYFRIPNNLYNRTDIVEEDSLRVDDTLEVLTTQFRPCYKTIMSLNNKLKSVKEK